MESVQYLKDLGQMVKSCTAPVHLVYDMLQMSSYDRTIVPEHGKFSKEHEELIGRIAVVTHLATVRFAIAMVLLLQRRPVRGFSSFPSAIEWIEAA